MFSDKIQPRRKSFSERVGYAAKSLCRGHAGPQFEACFAEADAPHIATTLMRRAEKNPVLKQGIKAAFGVTRWTDVPWKKEAARFRGMQARAISADARKVLATAETMMGRGLVVGPVFCGDKQLPHSDPRRPAAFPEPTL